MTKKKSAPVVDGPLVFGKDDPPKGTESHTGNASGKSTILSSKRALRASQKFTKPNEDESTKEEESVR